MLRVLDRTPSARLLSYPNEYTPRKVCGCVGVWVGGRVGGERVRAGGRRVVRSGRYSPVLEHLVERIDAAVQRERERRELRAMLVAPHRIASHRSAANTTTRHRCRTVCPGSAECPLLQHAAPRSSGWHGVADVAHAPRAAIGRTTGTRRRREGDLRLHSLEIKHERAAVPIGDSGPGHSKRAQRQSVGGGAHRSSASGPNRTSCAIRTLRLATHASACACVRERERALPRSGGRRLSVLRPLGPRSPRSRAAAGRARSRGALVWYCGYCERRELEVRLVLWVLQWNERRGGAQRRYRAVLRRVHFRVLEQAVPRVDDEVRHACARAPRGRLHAPSKRSRPPRRRPNARASSPADPPCGSAVRRRANARFDHAAEGKAAKPHRTTRQSRTGRRGSAAQDNTSAPHGATRLSRTGCAVPRLAA